MKQLIALILSLATASVSEAAATYIEHLKAEGFVCTAQTGGEVCLMSSVKASSVQEFSYSQPIAILVPTGLERPASLILYLHGYRGVCESTKATALDFIKEFDLFDGLKKAGAFNEVTVLPISLGTCTTYKNELVPQLDKFFDWSSKTLNPVTPKWVIAGHSGAGAVISSALAGLPVLLPRITGLALLDATFSMPLHIADWETIAEAASTEAPTLQVFGVYTSAGGAKSGSDDLSEALNKKKISNQFAHAQSDVHCKVPLTDFSPLLKRALQVNN